MLLRIPAVLNVEQLRVVRGLLARAAFVDGRLSAGAMARRVKRNEEVSTEASEREQLNNMVMGSLVEHPLYRAAALPHRVATPFYARYGEDMEYGPHIDDPVMGERRRYRSDIAVSVFLSDPESYVGGELVITTSFGEQYIKYPAGDAVMYPASSRHHVAKITKGERLVAVTWVQSLVRDAARRELLYELHQAREKLLQKLPDAEETRHVDTAYVNLVRMWAEI
jgi:PKHD-type hydroxylase